MNKTVLITGASRGIGQACAQAFAESGYSTVINYLKSEREALSLVQSLNSRGFRAIAVRADVSDASQVEKMVKMSISEFGGIDVLINNAGISEQKLFTEIDETDWDRMMDVCVKGAYNCTRFVLPYMINKKRGKIINVSSIWGITGASCEVHYSTAKAALIGFTKALAKELGPSGIQVNCVAPGIIETDMNSFLSDEEKTVLIENTPLLRFGRPYEIAKVLLFLASDAADFITGQVISPNGGFVI